MFVCIENIYGYTNRTKGEKEFTPIIVCYFTISLI